MGVGGCRRRSRGRDALSFLSLGGLSGAAGWGKDWEWGGRLGRVRAAQAPPVSPSVFFRALRGAEDEQKIRREPKEGETWIKSGRAAGVQGHSN